MLQIARRVIRKTRHFSFARPPVVATPEPAPAPVVPTLRSQIAERYLQGEGLEIGALHNPLTVPSTVRVRYVDRMSVDDLRQQYPELNSLPLVPVDIVDDGEQLSTVAADSQDFLIANHFLEHCEDPIGAIKQFLRVVKPGGILFIALPDKRYTFDSARGITPLEHLWTDHAGGAPAARRGHFEDFARGVHHLQTDEEVRKSADHYMARNYSIHFHVWTQQEMLELFLDLRRKLPLEFELIQKNNEEVLFILRKCTPH